MRQKRVELVHEILGDKIGPADHVEWIGEHWTVNFFTDGVQVLQDVLVDLHEDDLLVDRAHADLDWLIFGSGWPSPDAQNHLLLDIFRVWWIRHVLRNTVVVQTEQVHEVASWVQEPSDVIHVIVRFDFVSLIIWYLFHV